MPDDVKPASPLPLPLKAVGGEIYGAGSFLVARVTAGPGGTSVNSEHDRAKARAREIAAACNAYPGLVARVAELEAELAKKDELLHECLPAVRNNAQAEAEGGDPFAAAAWNVIADCVEASLAPKEPQ